MESLLRTIGNIIVFFRGIGNKIKSIYDNKFGKACILNLAIYLILNAIAYATFTCNIDIVIKSLLSNIAVLYQTSHVGFSNVLLMKALCILIKIVPGVSWYTWLLEITAFVGITLLGWFVLENHSGKSHVVALVVFNIFVGYECYMFPSYMKSAFVLAFATMIFFYHIYLYYNNSIRLYLFSIILLVFASMLSITGVVLAAISGSVVILIQLIIKVEFSKQLWKLVVTIIIAMVAMQSLHLFDNNFYLQSDIDESLILEYRDDIEKLIVFGYPTSDDELLNELGINESQYSGMTDYGRFYVADISSDSFNMLHKLADKNVQFNVENVLKYFRTVPVRQIKVGYLYLLIIIAFLMFCSQTRRKKVYIISSVIFLIIAGLIAYMNYAWDSRMTQMVVYLPLCYLLLANLKRIDGISRRDLIIGLIILGVFLYNNFSDQIVTKVKDADDMMEFVQEMDNDVPILAMDLNNILKEYSAYAVFPDSLLYGFDCIVNNGEYALYPIMEQYMYSSHMDETIMFDKINVFDPSWCLVLE